MSQVAHTGKHNRLTRFMYIYNVVNLHLGRFPVRCYHQRERMQVSPENKTRACELVAQRH
ncbi:Hap43p-repressed protein [Candida albicans SC5314]|nr:hypothetical protein MEU_01667 [Candida albicans P37005]KGR22322.1 hypothetical protein MG9_01677 [Candida albicans P37037]KGU12412.1 hypothetical protein MEQ_01657 [Candida albicans P87]KGU15881.1 hypothetical protein MEY_01680 [Candida albicans 19F]KGU29619.1 hypothetical protein MG7_01685 [Candida albicans P34048]KHC47294.1 Hap43p-repressed protein [Candida albicans Ca6]KHC59394.1 Hap43p-repressed protein [Candida albicans P37039]KHC81326.1 Hap43p-repressed protein [Candida albicans SC